MTRPTEYRFQLTVPIGSDELWEEIEALPSAKERRKRLKTELLTTLLSEGWFDCELKE